MKIMRRNRKVKSDHGEPVILFNAGEHTFAAPASDVEEIRDLQGLHAVDSVTERTSVSKVKATLERAKKTYYVVDASEHFGQSGAKPSRLIVLRDHPIGVLVDSIDRMAEIRNKMPLPRAFQGRERQWYSGLTLVGESVVPVVNMTAFLTVAEQAMAKAIVGRAAKGVTA